MCGINDLSHLECYHKSTRMAAGNAACDICFHLKCHVEPTSMAAVNHGIGPLFFLLGVFVHWLYVADLHGSTVAAIRTGFLAAKKPVVLFIMFILLTMIMCGHMFRHFVTWQNFWWCCGGFSRVENFWWYSNEYSLKLWIALFLNAILIGFFARSVIKNMVYGLCIPLLIVVTSSMSVYYWFAEDINSYTRAIEKFAYIFS